MKHNNSPVPGLARGIAILQLLLKDGPLKLEEASRLTGFPKASVMRILDTLSDLGLVGRDEITRRFSATVRLAPLGDQDKSFERRLSQTLDLMAQKTGQTSEWYVPEKAGLVLARRATPPTGELHVRARLGFVREWNGEIEAVVCIGRAWYGMAPSMRSKQWTYGPSGKKIILTPSEAAEKVNTARKKGYSADSYYNGFGVRRTASPVLKDGVLIGILAVAQCYLPGEQVSGDNIFEFLITETRNLSGIS